MTIITITTTTIYFNACMQSINLFFCHALCTTTNRYNFYIIQHPANLVGSQSELGCVVRLLQRLADDTPYEPILYQACTDVVIFVFVSFRFASFFVVVTLPMFFFLLFF